MRIEAWDDNFQPWSEADHAKHIGEQEFGGMTQDRDLVNFVRSQQRQMQAKNTPPEPDVPLPQECRWQLDENNEWALLVPQGRHGFTKYSGPREELTEFARNLVPM